MPDDKIVDHEFDPGLDKPEPELTARLIEDADAMSWKYWHRAPAVLDRDELLSLAYKGLSEARARWPRYCAEHHWDIRITRYYVTYCQRRMIGSILDYMRSQDWVTRTVRDRSRAIRDAGQDLGRTQEQLAEGTGMTRQQVSDTLAAMARRPVGFDPVEHDVVDGADTESGAVVSDLLGTAVAEMRGMPLAEQLVLVLTFYSGLSVRQAAVTLGMDAAEVAGMQQSGVLAIHHALARAAEER